MQVQWVRAIKTYLISEKCPSISLFFWTTDSSAKSCLSFRNFLIMLSHSLLISGLGILCSNVYMRKHGLTPLHWGELHQDAACHQADLGWSDETYLKWKGKCGGKEVCCYRGHRLCLLASNNRRKIVSTYRWEGEGGKYGYSFKNN